jgi:hypothetical protein
LIAEQAKADSHTCAPEFPFVRHECRAQSTVHAPSGRQITERAEAAIALGTLDSTVANLLRTPSGSHPSRGHDLCQPTFRNGRVITMAMSGRAHEATKVVLTMLEGTGTKTSMVSATTTTITTAAVEPSDCNHPSSRSFDASAKMRNGTSTTANSNPKMIAHARMVNRAPGFSVIVRPQVGSLTRVERASGSLQRSRCAAGSELLATKSDADSSPMGCAAAAFLRGPLA